MNKPTINTTEFSLLLQTLARIAHATEALAKAADPDYKSLTEANPTKPPAQVRRP